MTSLRTFITAGLVGVVIIVSVGGGMYVLSLTSATTTSPVNYSTKSSTTISSSTSNLSSSSPSSCELSETFTPIITAADSFGPMTYDSLNKMIYAVGTSNGDENLYEFNPATKSSIAVANLTYEASSIVFDPLSNTLYIANGYSSLFNTVTVVNASDYSIVRNISVSADPSSLVFDQANGEIYLSSIRSQTVTAFNASTNSVISQITLSSWPMQFAYDQENQDVYVTTLNGSSSRSGVDVIDRNNSIIAEIPVGTNGSSMITYDGANGDIYLASSVSNNVTIINPNSNKVQGNVSVV